MLTSDVLPFLVAGLAVGVVGLGAYAHHRKRRRKDAALARLLRRDRSLQPTTAPCDLHARELARFDALPAGDRQHGARYAVEGPVSVLVAGAQAGLRCAAFQWWYEVERRSGRHATYQTRTSPAVLAELPVLVPQPIVVSPESLLGRAGLSRGDQQLESTEFNRSFRVHCDDPALSLQLLDANLQTVLVEGFRGRTIEFRGSHLLLAGEPEHRDGSLEGVVGDLPAVRQDLQRLVGNVPPQFWRAIGADPHRPAEPR